MTDPHETQADAEAWARRQARVDELLRAFLRDLAVVDDLAVEDGIGGALALAIDERVIPQGDWQHLNDILEVTFAAQRARRQILGLDGETTAGPLDPRAALWAPVIHTVLINMAGGTRSLAEAMRPVEEAPTKPALRVLKGGAS